MSFKRIFLHALFANHWPLNTQLFINQSMIGQRIISQSRRHFSRHVPLLLLLVLSLSPITQAAANDAPHITPSIMVLGDSISAAHGIARDKGWVKLLEKYLTQHSDHKHYQLINASIGGETSGGALSRLPKLLTQYQPSVVIIELGGNDGLRGYPIKTFRSNLDQLVSLSKAANAKVLLAGMHIPPNYGPRYTKMFYASYGLTAQKFQVPLVPFLLENIAIDPKLMQKDGIHPTAQAQPQILQNVLPYLKGLL